jgi:phosphoglycolate phosphatase
MGRLLVFSVAVKISVIWDWNGTLLDDVQICISAANVMLDRRGLEAMTLDRYRRVFTFPVQAYYVEMGFDFATESFADVAVEYHEAYASRVRGASLHADAIPVLENLRELGIAQVVLSALEEGRLRNELRLREIDHYFSHAYGLSDLHARSKTARGKELLQELGSDGNGWWMIGDTDHDAEVAHALGVSCILVACGHHSEDRLKSTGARVVANLTEALEVLNAEAAADAGGE